MDDTLKTQLEALGTFGADTVAAYLEENLHAFEIELLDWALPEIIDGLMKQREQDK